MLHFTVKVNGDPIGTVHIQRNGPVVDGELSEYDVSVWWPGRRTRRATVLHNYDDGALRLIRLAIEAIDG